MSTNLPVLLYHGQYGGNWKFHAIGLMHFVNWWQVGESCIAELHHDLPEALLVAELKLDGGALKQHELFDGFFALQSI
jgi:hypothetical protein